MYDKKFISTCVPDFMTNIFFRICHTIKMTLVYIKKKRIFIFGLNL